MKMRDVISLLNIFNRDNEYSSLSLDDFIRAVEKNFTNFSVILIQQIYSEFMMQIKKAPNSNLSDIFLVLSEKFLDNFVYSEFYLKVDCSSEEFEMKNFDLFSCLVVLMETYDFFQKKIATAEITSDDLTMCHDIFKKELARMPSISKNFTKFSSLFSGYQRKDLIERANNCWKNMRKILKILFQS
jgi:hypothetical protein